MSDREVDFWGSFLGCFFAGLVFAYFCTYLIFFGPPPHIHNQRTTSECCTIGDECFHISTLECLKLKDIFLKQTEENANKFIKLEKGIENITIKLKNMPKYDTVVLSNVFSALAIVLCFFAIVFAMGGYWVEIISSEVKSCYKVLCDVKLPMTERKIINEFKNLSNNNSLGKQYEEPINKKKNKKYKSQRKKCF